MANDFKGRMIVFTAPSGAGKTTIVRHVLEKFDQMAFSVSATNREKRLSEREGVDYYFLSTDDFKEQINSGAFLEWEEVYEGYYYGTLKSEVERLWKLNKHIVFDIDVRGAMRLKELYGDKVLTIFIKAPSLEILVDRLSARNTDSRDSLQRRIYRIKNEMSYETLCDKVIFNNVLDDAFRHAESLILEILGK
ncbi:MAG TPA: guanylate kinase [Candidatus Dojkabacteria bacterium]